MLITLTEDELIELEFLRDQEVDAMINDGLINNSDRFNLEYRDGFQFEYQELTLSITTGREYPILPLFYTINNRTLPRLVVDALRVSLRRILDEASVKNNYDNWRRQKDSSFGIFEPHMAALDVVRETTSHLDEYRKCMMEANINDVSSRTKKVAIEDVSSIQEILDSDGIELSSMNTEGPATALLGMTLEQICSGVPTRYRILHVENVIRSDLRRAFLKRQAEMKDKLYKLRAHQLRNSVPLEKRRKLQDTQAEKDELIDYLTQPKLTFHGTQRHIVPSIVKTGFLLPDDRNPETGEAHVVRCGSTYGRGIYSSPDAHFSLLYSGYDASPTKKDQFGGMKLIVCATLMGRSAQVARNDDWRDQHEPYPGADSHVANQQYEYIVFDRRQIIPCYVIHLDWARDNKTDFIDIPQNPAQWIAAQSAKPHPKLCTSILSPGEIKANKKALMAKALKYFPYGYGPATGTTFVIEDVADVDEDEEEYGEYQADRLEGDGIQETYSDIWSWPSVTKFDQYLQERSAKSVKQSTINDK